jgi:hypothetical protein
MKNRERLLFFSLIVIIVLGGFSINFFLNREKDSESDSEIQTKMETLVDIFVTSNSTGSPNGKLAVRLHLPAPGYERYEEGAPVLVYGVGGAVADGLVNEKLANLGDVILISFIYPGGGNLVHKRSSDGVYDYRGEKSIQALGDVILYATGKKVDSSGKKLEDYTSYKVLYDNVGFIGYSFGGNIGIAVAALEPEKTAGLKYVIQWETPVSSQIATRDLGRMLLQPITSGATERGDYYNPRYISYHPLILNINYSSITYDPNSIYPVFLDGNNDGKYTTINGSHYRLPTPDLNDNSKLEKNEDFGLDTYWYDSYDVDGKLVYSRPVTIALKKLNVFKDNWPDHIATVEESNKYWDVRESVRLYEKALRNNPELRVMFLLSADDHVQKDPHKSHAHQAFDGWSSRGGWLKINPRHEYLIMVDSSLEDLPLNLLPPNTAPKNWEDIKSYCIPETIKDEIYCIAAVHELADLTQISK